MHLGVIGDAFRARVERNLGEHRVHERPEPGAARTLERAKRDALVRDVRRGARPALLDELAHGTDDPLRLRGGGAELALVRLPCLVGGATVVDALLLLQEVVLAETLARIAVEQQGSRIPEHDGTTLDRVEAGCDGIVGRRSPILGHRRRTERWTAGSR